MILTNSYLDPSQIEKKIHLIDVYPTSIIDLLSPALVIENVKSSFFLPGSHTYHKHKTTPLPSLHTTAPCHPRKPPKQRSGGKPIGTFLPTLATGSSLILPTPPTQISIRSETFIFGTATKGISAVISVNIRQRGTSKSNSGAQRNGGKMKRLIFLFIMPMQIN